MKRWPETEPSLLRRLVDPANDQAWRRFDSLYRPAVYRYARQSGLSDSDAAAVWRWSISSKPTRVRRRGDEDRKVGPPRWG